MRFLRCYRCNYYWYSLKNNIYWLSLYNYLNSRLSRRYSWTKTHKVCSWGASQCWQRQKLKLCKHKTAKKYAKLCQENQSRVSPQKADERGGGGDFSPNIFGSTTAELHTVRPNKKETRFISEISSLPRKIERNYMLHYQEHFLFFHLIPNT